MKRKSCIILAIIATYGLITACQYKKEVIEYPEAVVCDTSNVRYSVEVTNVISTNCSSCHASAVANFSGGGVRLDNHTYLKAYATSGLLLNVIMHTSGYNAMPKNGSKISDCNIGIIRTWIRNGMPDN
ncbi:MAG: cytochrome c [Chitinophagaceae bacterium]|nr:cytochrome c [Chitinophagaceae bacterium]MCW5905761.1 cytochrome c [Chitinophagaceae bacterium]